MMRVFIADDEEIIRDGIRNCIEKEQERFLFAGEAPDGEMALPMLMEMKPDVLITDIRMPFMDGLELAKVVRRTMPWLRIVFLSGHDEFEYAQKAVSLHADAYLLKPVSSAQLLETLGQVAEQIEQEQQQLRSEGANSRSEHEEDVLREHFLNDLLSGSVPTAEAAVQGERWGLLLTAKQYLVCIVRLPENAVQEQVRALTERLCGEESEVCAFFRGSRRLVLLLRGETEEAVRETAYEFCQNLRHELCQVLGWNALCAIGAPVSRVSALPESYRTAKDTLLQASACAEDGVFGSTDFAGVQHEFDFSAGGSLADKLRHAAPEDVPRIVEGYFGDSAAQDVQSVLYRYYLLMNLLVTASQLADEVQAGSIPPPEDPQAVMDTATSRAMSSARIFFPFIITRSFSHSMNRFPGAPHPYSLMQKCIIPFHGNEPDSPIIENINTTPLSPLKLRKSFHIIECIRTPAGCALSTKNTGPGVRKHRKTN